MTTTRVAVLDDSNVAIETFLATLANSRDVEVVATARDFATLEHMFDRVAVDVVLVDLLMPGQTGLSVIRQLSSRFGVVAVSGFPVDSEIAREARAQGAAAYVPKAVLGTPLGVLSLVSAIASARATRSHTLPVIAIAASAGGPEVVERLIAAASNLDVSVLVVQHLPPGRVEAFARQLASHGSRVRVARQGDSVFERGVMVAPGSHHMRVTSQGRVLLGDDPPLAGHRPAATFLFESLTPLGSRVMAVVLSGMSDDGSAAIPGLVAAGATCVAQDPKTCAVSGMPEAALRASRSVRSVPLDELGTAIRWFVSSRSGMHARPR